MDEGAGRTYTPANTTRVSWASKRWRHYQKSVIFCVRRSVLADQPPVALRQITSTRILVGKTVSHVEINGRFADEVLENSRATTMRGVNKPINFPERSLWCSTS